MLRGSGRWDGGWHEKLSYLYWLDLRRGREGDGDGHGHGKAMRVMMNPYSNVAHSENQPMRAPYTLLDSPGTHFQEIKPMLRDTNQVQARRETHAPDASTVVIPWRKGQKKRIEQQEKDGAAARMYNNCAARQEFDLVCIHQAGGEEVDGGFVHANDE